MKQEKQVHLVSQENSDFPLVSVGIPVYNEEKYINETLKSLAALDYPNIEYIISDNASTDSTLQICKNHCLSDQRFSLHASEENYGPIRNFKRVLDLANGEFFMWAGAHDRWHPGFVSKCVSILMENQDCVSTFAPAIFINERGQPVGTSTTAYDTRNVPYWLRPWITAWILYRSYAHPLYGLHRISVLKSLSLTHTCFGPDLVTLFEMAFTGATAFVCGVPMIEMRQNHTPGNWKDYFIRVYGTHDITLKKALRDTHNAYWNAIKNRTTKLRSRIFHRIMLYLYMYSTYKELQRVFATFQNKI